MLFWEVAIYEALCREEVQNPQLYCYYHTGDRNDYWLQLGPVRTEVLYENPRIVQFYDVVHDFEIEHIKSISRDMMDRSMVQDKGVGAKTRERKVLLKIFNDFKIENSRIKNFSKAISKSLD